MGLELVAAVALVVLAAYSQVLSAVVAADSAHILSLDKAVIRPMEST